MDENVMEYLEIQVEREALYCPNGQYLIQVQRNGMTTIWRKKMVQWMISVAQTSRMSNETVATAVNYMDRYLSIHSVTRSLLQLLAAVAMYLATKMHETEPIRIEELIAISQDKFTTRDIIELEKKMLDLFNWNLNPPTSFTIAQCFKKLLLPYDSINLDREIQMLHLCLTEYMFVQFPASICAICAVNLTSNSKSDLVSVMDPMIQHFSWSKEMLFECESLLSDFFRFPVKPSIKRSLSPTSIADFHDHVISVDELKRSNNGESYIVPSQVKRPKIS